MKTIQEILDKVNNELEVAFDNKKYIDSYDATSKIQRIFNEEFRETSIAKNLEKDKDEHLPVRFITSILDRNDFELKVVIDSDSNDYDYVEILGCKLRKKKVKISTFDKRMIINKIDCDIYNPTRTSITMDSNLEDVYHETVRRLTEKKASIENRKNDKLNGVKDFMEKHSLSAEDMEEAYRLYNGLEYNERRELKEK